MLYATLQQGAAEDMQTVGLFQSLAVKLASLSSIFASKACDRSVKTSPRLLLF